MPANPLVLVIDDDAIVRDVVSDTLRRNGFDGVAAEDLSRGWALLKERHPDLLILDIHLAGKNGLDLLRDLRHDRTVAGIPVILLTAESGEADRVVGLEMGADDYIAKPFSPRELIARVRSVLRRVTRRAGPAVGEVLQRDGLVIDVEKRRVFYHQNEVVLTATEFRIVEALARAGDTVLGRDAIHEQVHGQPAHPEDRGVDAHIKSIRRKLGEGGQLIETVRGFGYRMR